mmetsp:Transcript_81887/g.144583  ORF Transcript_81887/g.144583 Transcript_81887/m.144583 type:complete len:209 (+) Transcript_81887:1509-2135(+)
MRSRIYKPGNVINPNCADSHTPDQERQATPSVHHCSMGSNMQWVGLLEHPVEPLLLQITGIALVPSACLSRLMVKQPSHVGPPQAFIRCVRISVSLAVEVVIPVRAYPLNRIPLNGQDPTICKNVLQPLGGLERTVGQLPVEGQSDAQHPSDNVHSKGEKETLRAVRRRAKAKGQPMEDNHDSNEDHISAVVRAGEPVVPFFFVLHVR